MSVTVVVVHGIADPDRGATGKAVADLLASDQEVVPFELSLPGEQDGAGHRSAGFRVGPGVEVLEVFWGDLSRASAAWVGLLMELYRVILALPGIGDRALRSWQHDGIVARAAAGSHRAASFLLIGVLGTLNLCLAALVAAGLADWAADRWFDAEQLRNGVASVAFLAVSLGSAAAFPFLGPRKRASLVIYVAAPALGALAAGVVWLAALGNEGVAVVLTVSVLMVVAAGQLVRGVQRKWKRGIVPSIVGGVQVSALLYASWTGAARGGMVEAAEAVNWVIGQAWGLLAVLGGVTWLLAGAVVLRDGRGWNGDRARQAWTALVSLAAAIGMFAGVTRVLWWMVLKGVIEFGGKDFGPDLCTLNKTLADLDDSLKVLGTVVLLGFSLPTTFVLLPAIVLEVFPRWGRRWRAEHLGVQLTGLGGIHRRTLTILAVPLFAAPVWPLPDWFGGDKAISGAVLVALMAAVRGAAAPVRTAVDLLLDVSAWFEDGRRAPRGQMIQRCRAVLEAAALRSDRVVVVCHSQGTVLVAASLLDWEWKARGRVDLVTLGTPLRQIFRTCFPVDGVEAHEKFSWVDRPDAHTRLGVQRWVNLYGAADYVGRALWADTHAPSTYSGAPIAYGSAQVDRCVGPAAHTHYWTDETVRGTLADLVRGAA